MAHWMRPDAIYTSQMSTRYWCSECKKMCNYNHGMNAKKVKIGRPECKYSFCPWCGAEMEVEVDNV